MNNTWYDLADHFCAREKSLLDGGENQYFDRFAARRYNYALKHTPGAVRLVFLKSVIKDKRNKTLSRDGRFIWCKNLRYEGQDESGYRTVSFNIGNGNKRFKVSELDVVAIPNNIFINNNSYFKKYNKVLSSFSSVFEYQDALKLMKKNDDNQWSSLEEFYQFIKSESPYQPGTLISPRRGLFFPKLSVFQQKIDELVTKFCFENNLNNRRQELKTYLSGRDYITRDKKLLDLFNKFNDWCSQEQSAVHPVGIVLGRARDVSPHSGRELYRVSFAETIYEKIHPIQMEVINEIQTIH